MKYLIDRKNDNSFDAGEIFYSCLDVLEKSNKKISVPQKKYNQILTADVKCPSCNNNDAILQLVHTKKGYNVYLFCSHINNCKIGTGLQPFNWYTFLKLNRPSFFSKTKDDSKQIKELKNTHAMVQQMDFQRKLRERRKKDLEVVKTFKRIVDGLFEKNHVAIEAYKFIVNDLDLDLENNQNDIKFIHSLFYCDEGMYKNRIIYPFYNKDESIAFFQARIIDSLCDIKEDGKYFNINKKTNEKIRIEKYFNSRSRPVSANNLEFVDKKKPILVFESMNDSMFAVNAIGFGQPGKIPLNFENFLKNNQEAKFYIILDNDKTGSNYLKKHISNNKKTFYGFSWVMFFNFYNINSEDRKRFKDAKQLRKFFNVKYLTFELLKKFFTNNLLFL